MVTAGPNKVPFPRVILYCPRGKGNVRFLPSYSLCSGGPVGVFVNRMELAQVIAQDPLTETGAMVMADLEFDPKIPEPGFMIDAKTAKNEVTKDIPDVGTKRCNACHNDGMPRTLIQKGRPDLLLAKPISPFTKKSNNIGNLRGQNFQQFLMFTNEPGTAANEEIARSLSKVCSDIFFNRQSILDTNSPLVIDGKDLNVALNLCRRFKERSMFFDAGRINADANAIDPSSFNLGHGIVGESFEITVTNDKAGAPVTIDVAQRPFANFISGDRRDFVTNIQTKDGTCLMFDEGNPLPPGQSCTVEVTFDTGRGDRDAKPGPDIGVWDIVTRVTLTNKNDPANSVDLLPTVSVSVGP